MPLEREREKKLETDPYNTCAIEKERGLDTKE